MGRRLVIATLFLLLGAALYVGYLGWTSAPGVTVPTYAIVAAIVGVVLSALIGGGLMGLLFYSSRRGHDEPPQFESATSTEEEAPAARIASDDIRPETRRT